MMRYFILLSVWLAIGLTGPDTVSPTLTNDDVIRLVKAGFAEGVVLQAVELGDAQFDLSREALDKLRKAGVAENVITAIVKTKTETKYLRLLEPGIYFKRSDDYGLVPQERITWRGNTSEVQAGDLVLTRVELIGRVENRTSRVPLRQNAELLIVCEPGRHASAYQILRAEVKEDWRAFQAEAALRGKDLLGLSAFDRNAPPVQVDNKFDLGVRLILRALKPGEYGLIPPGVIANGRILPESEIYTFTIE
jgi:hypothetical protein